MTAVQTCSTLFSLRGSSATAYLPFQITPSQLTASGYPVYAQQLYGQPQQYNPGLWPGPPLMHSINPNPVSFTPMTATASAISPQDMVPKPFKFKFLTNQIKVCAGCRQGYQRRTDPPYMTFALCTRKASR